MLQRQNLISFFSLILFVFIGCKNEKDKATYDSADKLEINKLSGKANQEFLLKPVYNDYKLETGRNRDDELLKNDLSERSLNMMLKNNSYALDSSQAMLLSFENQKEIVINKAGFNNLTVPGNHFLDDIYLNSRLHLEIIPDTLQLVKLKKVYNKDICNLGNVKVFEYNLFCIILKSSNGGIDDFNGYVLTTECIYWKEFGGCATLEIIANYGQGYASLVPMVFQQRRFVPIGHFELGKWNAHENPPLRPVRKEQ